MPLKRNISLALVVLLLTVALPRRASADDLADLVDVALTRNPSLDAIASEVAALEEKTSQVGAWKDPVLTLAYQNVPIEKPILGEEPMSMLRLQVGQKIPFFGKTDKREEVVRKSIAAKRWEIEEQRVKLRSAVKEAYYRLGLTRQLKRLTEEHITLVQQLIDTVLIKYEVGRAQQQHLLRLEVLRDRLRDDLNDFDQRSVALVASLNATLHRDVATPIATPETFVLEGPIDDAASLRETANTTHPALKRLDASAAMYHAAADLAEAETIPDPTVFAAYGVRTEFANGMPARDLVTLGVSVPIPVLSDSTYGARSRESRIRAEAAGERRAALLDRLGDKLAGLVARWDRAAKKVEAYHGTLVPAAQRTLDATFSSYQVDRADFTSLFEAELDLLNFEKTIRVSTVDGLVAQALIEELIGKELP